MVPLLLYIEVKYGPEKFFMENTMYHKTATRITTGRTTGKHDIAQRKGPKYDIDQVHTWCALAA
jgi:hypothetical protein